jgi:alpha-1,2-mannosyltransferase
MFLVQFDNLRPTVSRPTANSPIRGLWTFVVCNSILLNAFLAATSLLLLSKGTLVRSTVASSLSAAALYFFRGRQGTDSWAPMLNALQTFFAGKPIYYTTFFADKIKFQYPLSSLVPLYALKKMGIGSDGIFSILNVISWCAIVVTIAVSALMLVRTLRKRGVVLAPKDVLALSGLTALSGIFFYPLVKAYSQGQIQSVIDALFALALYSWLRGNESTSGFLTGLMCLIKPQYAIVALWFAIRRKFGALLACLAIVAAGLSIAIVLFGWREQLDYLGVLSFMSKHGELYFPNQSVNGLLHRLLLQGNNLQWEPNAFAPFSVLVYSGTILSSFILLAAASYYGRAKSDAGSARDFCMATLAATMASPIVWEHHYGVVFPMVAYLAGSLTRRMDLKWLAVCFVLVGNCWSPFNVFAGTPVLNVLQSLCFFGGLALFVLFFRSGLSAKVYEGLVMPSHRLNGRRERVVHAHGRLA